MPTIFQLPYMAHALAYLLAAAIFILDLLMPLGYTVWILYLFPLILTFTLSGRTLQLLLASLSTVLIWAGFYYSPPGLSVSMALLNRISGTATLWLVTFFLLRQGAYQVIEKALAYTNAIVETVRDPLLVLDSAHRVKTANRSFLETFRLTQRDTDNVLLYDLDQGQWNIPELRSKLEEILPQHSELHDFEVHRDFPHLGNRTILVSARPLYRPGNNTEMILISMEDISERKRHEEAQRQLAAIVESSDDAIIGKTLAGIVTSWNKAAERLYGYTAEEIIDRPITLLLPSDRLDEELQIIERLRRGERIEHFETVRRRKDGRNVEVSLTISPIKDATGRVIGASKIARDISEQKRAQEERDRFFSLSLDMFCFAGFDGYFKYVNPAWEKTLGYSVEELLSSPYLDFIHPEDRDATIAEAQKQTMGKTVIAFENRYRCKDGSYRWFLWNAIPVAETQLIYATAHDITDRKRAEAQLNEHAAQLQTLNSELEAFSYSVSHDLRAPIRHIDGFAELLQKNGAVLLDAKGKRYLNMISDSAKQMGHLIDDLLVFSRMGRTQLQKTTVHFDQLVKEVLQELAPDTQNRQISWQIAPLPDVHGDAAMLRQVWVNLIANAVKYTRQRDLATIEIGTLPPSANEHVMYIRDNGAGFDMQYMDKLFGVFQRLHRAEEFEGTGIGLANVRRIITRHGGRVWAEGKTDEGATFYVALPNDAGGSL
jgi:PAS domain S-box-containing protein